jgi:cutinase
MASDVKTILARCPATKIVLSGYSQGAMVAHNAFTKGGLAGSQAHAAVLFGDPYNGQGVGTLRSNVVKEFCATGDSVCDGSGSYAITQAHSTYGNNADEAATFIISALGL